MYKIVQTTTNDKETALNISKILINEKISACVHIIENVNSLYKWNNNIKIHTEYLLQIKCNGLNIPKVSNIINKYHNYDVPEIICINMDIINKKYQTWLEKNC